MFSTRFYPQDVGEHPLHPNPRDMENRGYVQVTAPNEPRFAPDPAEEIRADLDALDDRVSS